MEAGKLFTQVFEGVVYTCGISFLGLIALGFIASHTPLGRLGGPKRERPFRPRK